MAEDLAKLVLRMEAQTAQYQRELEKSREKLNRIDRTTKKMQENTRRRFAAMESASNRLKGAVAGMVAAFTLHKFSSWIKSSIDGADRANKFAQQVGVATETLTGLDLGLKLSGTNMKSFEGGLVRLNRSISDADQGLATQKRAFSDLGISVRDSKGELKSSEQVLREVADKFSQMEDGVRKTARAQEIFGRSGAELIPFLNQGSDGLDRMIDRSRDLGLVWTRESAAAAEAFNDKLTILGSVAEGIGNQVARDMLPIMSDLADYLIEVSEDGSVAATVANALSTSLKGVAATTVGAVAAFELLGKAIGSGLAALDVGLEDAEWYEKVIPVLAARRIYKNLGDVKGALDVSLTDINETIGKYAVAFDKIWAAGEGEGSGLADRIAAIRGAFDRPDGDSGGSSSFLEDQIKEIDKLIDRAHKSTEIWSRARDAANQQLQGVVDSLMTEEEQIRASYERRQQIILDNTAEASQKQAALLARLEMQKNEQLEEINRGYWERYLAAADEALTNLNDIAATTISNFASGVGNAFESMIFDAESAREAFQQLGEGMARSIVRALGEMAAQWLAYQAVQLLVGKTTAAAGAAAMIGQAQAASALAAINSFASTAAIPVVGPAAAPAAAAAATAATAPYVATVAAASFAGMFDEGGNIPAGKWGIAGEVGPEIIHGPAHVTSRADTAKMFGGDGVTVNVNNAPAGTSVQRRQVNGREFVDVMVADVNDDGPFFRALQSKSNVRRVGS